MRYITTIPKIREKSRLESIAIVQGIFQSIGDLFEGVADIFEEACEEVDYILDMFCDEFSQTITELEAMACIDAPEISDDSITLETYSSPIANQFNRMSIPNQQLEPQILANTLINSRYR